MRLTARREPLVQQVRKDGQREEDGAMGPWSFPIVAEARMAERLLEAERARLARTAATGQGSQGRREGPQPQASPSSRRRLLLGASVLALAGCLVVGGPVVGRAGPQTAAEPVVVPVHVLFRTATVARAGSLVLGEVPSLPPSPCGVPTFGWVHGPAAWLLEATLLQAPVLLPVCPLP